MWRTNMIATVLIINAVLPRTSSFLQEISSRHYGSIKQKTNARQSAVRIDALRGAEPLPQSSITDIEVVLFGTGDFRTTDHAGLSSALSSSMSNDRTAILPLVILDTINTLPNIPMVRSHTIDTASMISASLNSLQRGLKDLGMDLHVTTSSGATTTSESTAGSGTQSSLLDSILSHVVEQNPGLEKVTIHACDLGAADNIIGYGPFQHLLDFPTELKDVTVDVRGWNCDLRAEPRRDIYTNGKEFPDVHGNYLMKYDVNMEGESDSVVVLGIADTPNSIISDTKGVMTNELSCINIEGLTELPSVEEITKLLCSSVHIDLTNDDTQERMKQECNTGLYATHWGGLDIASTMTEEAALKAADAFLTYNKVGIDEERDGDEALVEELGWWTTGKKLMRNPMSLEHASTHRFMSGGVTGAGGAVISTSLNEVKTGNLIKGEVMTRYLAAPLLFGTISPRYLWNRSHEKQRTYLAARPLVNALPPVLRKKTSSDSLKSIIDGREWFNLLASKDLSTLSNSPSNDVEMAYKYWRWHGFLCRYATSPLNNASGNDNKHEKQGVVLIHGFGASGGQWTKAMSALGENLSKTSTNEAVGFAPDLIGFGHSDKPSITYTQYMWESYSSSFIKEVVLGQKGCDSYFVGGNSIGGYTAMGVAAGDSISAKKAESLDAAPILSASGAPGSEACNGLVLMNSAGNILTEDDVIKAKDTTSSTIAEATGLDLLGDCSPPNREVAEFGGNGLLWYLRPRIQSICKNVYPENPGAVDDTLCDNIFRDSLDPGAINVMISGGKLPPPRTANELLDADFGSSRVRGYESSIDGVREGVFSGSVLVAQGMLDPLNDAKTRASNLSKLRKGITVNAINAGHCPHDELPEKVSESIAEWMIDFNTNKSLA